MGVRKINFLNCRLLGGTIPHLSQNRVYRSGELEQYPIFKNLNDLDKYIDLRSDAEVLEKPYQHIMENNGVKYIRMPIQNYDYKITKRTPDFIDYANYYEDILDVSDNAIKYILNSITYTDDVLGFGCSAGKDRTGVVSSIILMLLDIEDHYIAQDYSCSSNYLIPKIDFFKNNWVNLGVSKDDYYIRLNTQKEAMLLFLEKFKKKYFDIESYILSIGMSREDISKFKKKINNGRF